MTIHHTNILSRKPYLILLLLLMITGTQEAWGRHNYFSQNYEAESNASSWSSANYSGGLSLVTGDATYGKYISFAQSGGGLSGPRTAYTNFNISEWLYDSYTIEFDVALKTCNTTNHYTELVVAAEEYSLEGNKYFVNANDDKNNFLFMLRSNGAANSTTYFINNTSSRVTIAAETWFHVKLNVDVVNKRVAYTISGGASASGTYEVTDGTSMDAKSIVTTIGKGYYGAVKIDNIEIYSTWYYLKTDIPTTLVSTGGAEGVTVSHPYPHYVLSGNTLYRYPSTGSNPNYVKTFTLTSTDNQEVTITNNGTINNVVAYREAEDFMTPVTGNNYIYIRCSNAQGAYANTYVDALSLPRGVYKLTTASYANNSTSFNFKEGNDVVFTHTGSGGWSETTSGNIQVPANTAIQVIGGSRNYGLDYVYAQAQFAYMTASGELTKGSTTTPTLTNSLSMDGHTITYASSNVAVASVNGTGLITANHNGTAVITASYTNTSTSTVEYTASYTVTVTGETSGTVSFSPGSPTTSETFTVTGDGKLEQTYNGSWFDLAMGSADEVQIAETIGGEHGVRGIDINGYSHVLASTGLPTMGSYFAITPKQNGILSFRGYMNEANGIRLTDADGVILERISASSVTVSGWANYNFTTFLNAGSTYYVFAETEFMTPHDGATAPTLYINSMTLTKSEGITINLVDQSLLFFPNNNGNYNRLDRTIPGFELKFNGDGVKYQSSNTFIVRHTDAVNSYIKIIPRIENPDDVEITGVRIIYDNATGFYRTPKLTIGEDGQSGEEKTLSSSEISQTWTGSMKNVKIQLTNSEDGTQFLIKAISITYNLKNSATLNMTKGDIDLMFNKSLVYGYSGDRIENKFWIDSPKAFYGDVSFFGAVEPYGDGFGFWNGNTNEPVKIKDGSDNKTYYRDVVADPDEEYKVLIGQGACMLQARTAETTYFNAGYAETRIYSRDYVEERKSGYEITLAQNEEYVVPAASGLSFAITTSGGTITLTGTAESPGTIAADERFLTTATGSEITIKNTGESDVTIKKIEVFRKTGTLYFIYTGSVGAGNDVMFCGESYLPDNFVVSGEDGIADKYATSGTYAITSPLEGVSINASTGELTIADNATEGTVQVTLTVNPLEAYKDLYAPITYTITLNVIDGMWDFRTYSRDDHRTMYNSTGWNGEYGGWYAGRDNADFEYILRKDGTPLPVAFTLQSRGKHRLLHTNHGFLHLQGRGVGVNESANGGGELIVPVKAGMHVEINAYSDDKLSEMELENVTDLDGNDVNNFYVNNGAAESQYFLAKDDGYLIIRNPSYNLDLHIVYIKVTAEMVFKFGEETYVEKKSGTWSNPLMNKGITTLSYVYSNATSSPVSSIDSETGEVTLADTYGVFTVTATGSGTGLLAGKTGTYNVNVVSMAVTDGSQSLSSSAAEFTLTDRITITGTSGSEDASLKDEVVFSLVNPVPSVTLSGTTLTVEGVQSVEVKATLGSIEKTFTCSVTGASLVGGLNPVISNTTSSYSITIQGEGVTKYASAPYNGAVYFDRDKMRDNAIGDIKAKASSFTYTEVGNTLTINFNLDEGEKIPGGVIPIIGKYTYGGNSYDILGTITIPYESHVWRFQHNLVTGMNTAAEDDEEDAYNMSSTALEGYGSEHGLTGGLAKWITTTSPSESRTAAWGTGATMDEPVDDETNHSSSHDWRYVHKILGHPESNVIYYYNHPVAGDNALVIPETEGLQIFSTPSEKQFGVEMLSYNSASDPSFNCQNMMLLRGGKFTIPQLKAGQWIEIRWTRHKEDAGERIIMDNLSDFDANPITSVYKIHNCYYNLANKSTSSYMFQTTADGDVTFEVADNIYVSIQQIILHEPGWEIESSFVSQLSGYDDTQRDGSDKLYSTYTAADWESAELGATTAPRASRHYVWNDGAASHTVTFLSKQYQNAPSAPQTWDIEVDETLRPEGKEMEVTSAEDEKAILVYKDGWGKVHVTMTCYTQDRKYVANKKTWTITFGQAPKQTYPYTWDFTKYFIDTKANIGTDSWTTSGDVRTANTTDYDLNSYSSYYVEGAQLVSYNLWEESGKKVLPETAGLGFKLDTNSDGTPDASLSLDMESLVEAPSRGEASMRRTPSWSTGKMTLTGGGTIIVPAPGAEYADYYIYINSSVKPSTVTNAEDVSGAAGAYVTNTVTDGHGQFKYHFTANANAEITFNADVNVYAIGVTKTFKTLENVGGSTGWATESRDVTIDYTLDNLLTTNPVKAYVIIEQGGNPVYSDDKTKTTVKIEDERFVVPANNGLVLKQTSSVPGTDGTQYSVPLFVPAVTTSTDAASLFTNNLMRPNVTANRHYMESVGFNGSTYVKFLLAKRYMTWKKEGATLTKPTAYESRNVASFYRWHIYTADDVAQIAEYSALTTNEEREAKAGELNTLGANKAYLLLRADQIADPLWSGGAPAKPRHVGIEGESDMEDINDYTETKDNPRTNHTYNLNGQVVDDDVLPPGIYIKNGKKILVR